MNKPLEPILREAFDAISQKIAGGVRTHPEEFRPGATDPLEGLIPHGMEPEVDSFDWFDPTVWANAAPGQQMDFSAIRAASGPGRDGKGLDWFRGGEAPNNFANRHNPLYQARRSFAMQIAPNIEKMFGVDAGGVGYMRPPSSADAAPGGRSANSDHQSGGALDFYGSKEQLTNLRNWLIQQPWASFVRWQSESHYDHLHVSFDLGWVAQNFGAGQMQVPTYSGSSYNAPELPNKPPSQPTQTSGGSNTKTYQ